MSQPAVRPLIVFADDWGRHPSSCQHLIRQVLPHRAVTWVNTIGTRPPRLDWGTVKRVAGKLREWTKPRKPPVIPDAHPELRPTIVAPKMWPSFKSSFARGLNRRLLVRALRPVFESQPQPPIVVTTLPLVADLVGHLPAYRWVYYCVDDFSVWPGYDGETMQRMERDLVPNMDAVVAVSDTLVTHIGTFGKKAHLLTHGVDLSHWSGATPVELPELAGLTPPFVVFWGVIDRRMDGAFVTHLANNLSAGTLVFVGPKEDPDAAIFQHPRIAVLPPMPFGKLPTLAAAASVLVMPYADLPVTRAMQPLKMKEYLATGKPAVVRGLPATRAWADCLDVCDSPEQFTAKVNERLTGGLPVLQSVNRGRLDDETWAGKAKRFEAWLDG